MSQESATILDTARKEMVTLHKELATAIRERDEANAARDGLQKLWGEALDLADRYSRERDEARNETTLAKMSADAAGSLLLDVQRDCITAVKERDEALRWVTHWQTKFQKERTLHVGAVSRLASLTAEVKGLREALKGLVDACECASPDFGEDLDRARLALTKREP